MLHIPKGLEIRTRNDERMEDWLEDRTRLCRTCCDYARQDPRSGLWGCRGCGVSDEHETRFRSRETAA